MQRPLKLVILAGITLVLFYFIQDSFFNEENYTKPLLAERENKDLSFRSQSNSPFTEEGRRAFRNLNYYEPKPEYQVKAAISYFEKQDTLHMPMTNGTTEAYLTIGTAAFELDGQPQKLTVYKKVKSEEVEKYFVPFTDKTNGFETYGGGRYLDVPIKENAKTLFLDFNRAYNPFCAYNPDFVCPVPPKESRLTVAVPAGEKNYETAK
ncbi:DUF1684 domain-containing protein [Pontibacter arcticus]|uniref:DUF1684 domain-containing protein n=1 Tax=Pontibacter arcticus TaxID=2080288 RepID=A0A364RD14_9BACT|nr:DUF1684 domain-containing protein [Pontibacter arcticus]RAU82164.1 DUF1684 domain-containing protein [Pontibacter arcticus]